MCASTPIIHVVIGVLLACGVMSHDPGDRTVGFFMAPIASAIVLIGWIFSAGVIFTGRCLGRRTRYPFCFVMACLCCANIPLGTVLGVFTIIVLARPGVRELFDVGAAERGAAPEQGSRTGGEEIQPFPPTSI